MTKVYAGIGSREITEHEWALCFKIGAWLAKQGWALRTGACKGADQAFAEGALSEGGEVILCLPWPAYEFQWVEQAVGQGAKKEVLSYYHKEAVESVKQYHPAYDKLSDWSKALHSRNYLIVKPSKFVIAWPKPGVRGGLGGTGQGIRVAAGLGIKTIRMDEPMDYRRVCDKVNG